MTETHSHRGRIQITGFDADRVTERDRISDWTGEIETETEGRWKRAYRRFKRNRSALIGLSVVLIMSLAALFSRPITLYGI
ncbi:hypothetical protein QA784_14835, partial [Listeria monocytogenes]|nr:hypothetical protein [Listeria monocytogenes]